MSVAITRQQTSKRRKSLKQTFYEIIVEDGFCGLYKGLRPALVLVVNPTITYGLFDPIKKLLMLLNSNNKSLSVKQVFFVGAIAKAIVRIK